MHVVDKNIFQAVISGIARATFKRKEFSADTRFLPLYPSPLHPVKRKIRGMGGGDCQKFCVYRQMLFCPEVPYKSCSFTTGYTFVLLTGSSQSKT